jgi:hypothetical protein
LDLGFQRAVEEGDKGRQQIQIDRLGKLAKIVISLRSRKQREKSNKKSKIKEDAGTGARRVSVNKGENTGTG